MDGWQWRRNRNGMFHTRSFYVALRREAQANSFSLEECVGKDSYYG